MERYPVNVAHTAGELSGPRNIKAYAGVNASLALPMTPEGNPDLDGLRRYASWIADQGVIGVTVNADTGEGAHLSAAERVAVVETVKSEIGDRLMVASGLIASHTSQAVEIAEALRDAGADSLLIFSIPAFAGQPLAAELVYRYFAAIGDVGLPLIAFNLTPSLGGVILSPEVIARLADVAPLQAIKEASFDATCYVRTRDAIRQTDSDIAFLSGCDNFMYESFVLGADGALLGYAGLAAELTKRVFDLVLSGDYLAAEQLSREKMQPLAQVMFGAPMRNSRARIKEGLRLLGLIEHADVRPPLLNLDAGERGAIRAAMSVAGLL